MFQITIQIDDNGQYSVGEEPMNEPNESGITEGGSQDMMTGSTDNTEMQPAKNLDDALNIAKQMLMDHAGQTMNQARNEVASQVWKKPMAGGM